ncbi:uncharacterized protein (DUF427 family) [Onishia taeanensis]|uniref:Uncharacterized protein (DUF427 family) n=1 Tax=Onishia taeanensis TaxID=284577 RepID=A0A328XN67_9GAMM|nr:DUF427 domain-containing protein [Halomonas taeanensis]RAR59808.1 uncharacterized protein (DUF427 family) [Halomonas taeanensis]
MLDTSNTARITLHPHTRRVRIYSGDTLIADTKGAIELRERGYPNRHYIPKEDVDMSKLSTSSTVTHCPFKGDSTYYSLSSITDVAWSYDQPVEQMQAIAGRLAFDTKKVTQQTE